jgi:hypothetical protein
MACISRITDDTYSQKFGNDHHKFYVEMRCGLPCIPGLDVCAKCSKKLDNCKTQHSRQFNHGKINEPIPSNSHIYGGKWFYDSVKKYGMPTDKVIHFAEEYKNKARVGFDNTSNAVEYNVISDTIKKDRKKRPKIADITNNKDSNSSATSISSGPVKRRKNTVKKTESSPYISAISNTPQLVYKEITIPSHIERNIETFDTDGFAIEYIKLTEFVHNGTVYYRDSNKNKLYKKVKDKIGGYVGRYDSVTDSINSNILDSDDEHDDEDEDEERLR